ncbi:MAG TPA: tetratricopeptide repeat protein [Candidatus Binatus sp.]|nr:tetratricopeptide repeat protein [Candidatus Binatus sp.]
MAQRLTRRELKTDEVRDTLVQGAGLVFDHQAITFLVLILGVVIALGIFGWKTYAERQTVKAAAAYDDAMKVFDARIRSPLEPQQPGELSYTDEKNKYTESVRKFEDVASKYARTRPGQLASYYEAISQERLGNNDAAKKLLQNLADSGDEDFAAMARFELAQLDDRLGQGDEAVNLYKKLIAKPAVLVPKPVVMLALAQHYTASNPAEASKLYAQIKSEYPDTPMAEQADQELSLLPGKI